MSGWQSASQEEDIRVGQGRGYAVVGECAARNSEPWWKHGRWTEVSATLFTGQIGR